MAYQNKSRNGKVGANRKNKSNKGKSEVRTNKEMLNEEESKDSNAKMGKLSTAGRHNDPNWYFLDAAIANEASSFSFDQYVGVETSLPVRVYGSTATSLQAEAAAPVPAIMVLEMAPSPGDTSDIKTGINIAALKTYSTLSSMNAKTVNYAPQDITTLILGVGEIISTLEHIRRAFGVAFTYNQRNRSLPYKLLDGMGFNPDDFLDNIAQHRLQFNSWITAINKLPLLNNIAYLYKCMDIYQNVYMDSDSSMAQIVLMKPNLTWRINETYSDQGTGLSTVTLPGSFGGSSATTNTWDKWAGIVDDMIDTLFTSATYNYIYSDILNYSTKTGAKLFYMDYLREDYSVVPQYNRTFMLQVHNATIAGVPNATQATNGTTRGNDVAPNVNKNIVDYNPLFRGFGTSVLPTLAIVDFDTSNPSLEDRIEATRYIALMKFVEGAGTQPTAVFAGAPDHFVTHVNLQYGADKVETIDTSFPYYNGEEKFGNIKPYVLKNQVDWSPLMVITSLPEEGNTVSMTLSGDVNYYTTLDPEWFARVNDLTFQALFTLR